MRVLFKYLDASLRQACKSMMNGIYTAGKTVNCWKSNIVTKNWLLVVFCGNKVKLHGVMLLYLKVSKRLD